MLSGIRRGASAVLAPAALGIAYVLLTFNALPTPTTDLIRPFLIVVAGAIALTMVAALATRSLYRGSVIASTVVVGLTAPFLIAAAIAAVVIVTVIQLLRRRWTLAAVRSASARQVSTLVRVLAFAFLVVAVVTAGPAVIRGVHLSEGAVAADEPAGPNMYVLLLDGYPRADTLETMFGFDNQPFLDGLEGLGFTVATNSRSNYNHTWMTLASLLNGAYIEDLIEPGAVGATEADQFRTLTGLINDAAMLDRFRTHGYEIHAVPAPFMSLGLESADENHNSGQLTAFEYSLLENSVISRFAGGVVADFAFEQQRGRFQATLSTIGSLADADQQHLVFAHIFSPPHAPLLYAADGQPMPPPDCLPSECAIWEFPDDASWNGLPDQLEYLNSRLLETVSTIVENDPSAVVVLLSDHGSRRTVEDLDEHFHSFFAARTPERSVFDDDPHPVNVLRLLAETYINEATAPLPYRSWVSPIVNRPLATEPVAG